VRSLTARYWEVDFWTAALADDIYLGSILRWWLCLKRLRSKIYF